MPRDPDSSDWGRQEEPGVRRGTGAGEKRVLEKSMGEGGGWVWTEAREGRREGKKQNFKGGLVCTGKKRKQAQSVRAVDLP